VTRQTGKLVFLVAGGFLAIAAPASEEPGPAVRIAARIVSDREVEITAQYRLPDPERAPSRMNHIAIRIPGQSLEILDATARGRTLAVVSTLQDGALRYAMELPDPGASEYEIRYRLRSDHNARLPLLVPVAGAAYPATPGGCEISVSLPYDWVSVGYEFPWFERLNGGLRATLPDLPALIVIQGRRRGDVGLLDRWFTLDHLTNAGLFLLLIAASSYRFLLSRRGGGKAGAS
jgi:hypothetical protein